jgi:uncharacterized damage-inducible protein DinB
MTLREFHLQTRKNELPAFQRVLKALPLDQMHYSPHEKSQSATRIVWTLISESHACSALIETGKIVFENVPPPEPERLLPMFTESYEKLLGQIARMDEAAWNRIGQFIVGGRVVMEQPTGNILWMFLLDAIHHRGQLSTYIRPMGGKVPSIYGPSGDDPGPLAQ